jgi:anti-sigma regulatory factor (Ser/Thr protein kinase)
MILDWGTAGSPIAGELTSGDRGVIVPFPGGALVAVYECLGHGREAAAAAARAERVMIAAPYAPVIDLIERCHQELKGTRGAVTSVASFDAEHGTMTWLGVGNVEALLIRADAEMPSEAVAMRGGTVGFQLPRLHPRTLQVYPGDTLVLASDGIKHGFKAEVLSAREPQHIADEILRLWSRTNDDALVVVARYLGPSDARRIGVDGEGDVAQARIRTRELAEGVGLPPYAIEELAIAVSELARNMVTHAGGGEIVIARSGTRDGVTVIARDLGPGIPDVDLALQDGYSTSVGMGCGLSGARRLVDRLEISSHPGIGTVVTIEKWLS